MRQRLRELAGERRRFGYRRLGILLAREGVTMNHKKLLRLYREEGLAVRRRRPRAGCRLTEQLGVDCIPVGVIIGDDAIHAPNERYDVERLHKGIRSWARILSELSSNKAA